MPPPDEVPGDGDAPNDPNKARLEVLEFAETKAQWKEVKEGDHTISICTNMSSAPSQAFQNLEKQMEAVAKTKSFVRVFW